MLRRYPGRAADFHRCSSFLASLSHGAWRLRDLRKLLVRPTLQEEFAFLQTHPLIRDLQASDNSASPAWLAPLDVRLQEAAASRLTHAEFLELILKDELNVRKERLLSRRTQSADFRHLKTLEDFDWRFNPSVPRQEIYDLATGQFIRQSLDLLFLGSPGVGKTHLAQALGYEAIKQGFLVLYRSTFELVREFLRDEAFNQQDHLLRKYLKPDLYT